MGAFGSGTFGAGTFAASGQTASPDGINDALTLDTPTATTTTAATPDGVNDLDALDAPSTSTTTTATPDGINDGIAADAPVASAADIPDRDATVGDVNEPITLDPPTAAVVAATTVDDGPAEPVTLDPPSVAFAPITPDGINDADALDPPAVSTAAAPDEAPALGVAVDDPAVAFAPITPDGINDALTLDTPTADATSSVAPDEGPAEPVALDAPTVAFAPITPDGIAAPLALDTPTLTVTAAPDGLAITISLDPPGVFKPWAGYATPDGARLYLPQGPPQVIAPPTPPDAPEPVPIPTGIRPNIDVARHLLGVGPWNAGIAWKGAPNYGRPAGTFASSAPVLNLPDTTSKSFTLRLNAGDEARTDFVLPRANAFLVEQRTTDLWWRRRDPTRAIVEPIGRFNAETVDITMNPDGLVKISATYQDYRSLLEDRLILATADHPIAGLSSWDKGTNITDILQFVIPTNAGLDLAEITTAPVFVGTITQPIELPPGTTVLEAITNLAAISTMPTFEWWVELPDANGARPKLRLAPTGRGQDQGVYLIETGTGQSPITSWQIQAAGNKYANALYFQGGTGGVVYTLPADVATYGQRDAQETDTSLKGNLPLIQAAATKRLAELGSQQITWTLNLRPGFWQGRSHIDVGDTVTARINLGGELITGTHRVSEISVDIDTDGTEEVSLTLGPPRPAKDPRSRYSAMARFVRKMANYTRQST